MAYSPKAKEKATAGRKLRKLNPQQTSRKLTKLKYSNPIAYDIARKKETKRSVVSGQSGLKPRSAISKKGPMKARKKKPKSKLMSAKKYIGQGSKTPATPPVKKRVVTSKILHKSGAGSGKKPVSSYAKKVKSQKNNWTSAGPNAVPAQGRRLGTKTVRTSARGGGAYAKGEGTQTARTPRLQRFVRAYDKKKRAAPTTAKKATAAKRSRGGGGFIGMVHKQRKTRSKRY